MRMALAICALLLAPACSGSRQDPAASDPVALVRVAKVESGQVEEKVLVYGAAENAASSKYVLAAPVEANVLAVDAPAGTAVRAGQVIVRLAPSPSSQLELARATAERRSAEQAYARALRLRADGLVSNAEVDSARAAAATARATVASLSVRGSRLTVRSPGSGYVETVSASAGDLVAPGTSLVTIARSGDVRVRFGIDPSLARRLRAGAGVRVKPAGDSPAFTLPILSVDPVVDPRTRLASIFAQVPAAAGIGPGESLTGEVTLAAPAASLTIPYRALLDDGGQPFVFVLSKGRAYRRDVVTGAAAGDRIAIVGGLHPGEIVVVDGGTALADGMKVRLR